tara:strand:+ start:19 stop:540 length:522 start_codon:yes stop_codon:yes gene_type:complete
MDSNIHLKNKILDKTLETKEIFINSLETIEKQNELIEDNYNKISDINNEVKESYSLIKKIKKSCLSFFKCNNNKNKNNNYVIKKINITNEQQQQEQQQQEQQEQQLKGQTKKNFKIENNFEDRLLNELNDIHDLSKIQNKEINKQTNILKNMNKNSNYVINEIKFNNNQIKNL